MARIGIKDYLRVEGLTKTFSSTSVKEKKFQGSLRVLDIFKDEIVDSLIRMEMSGF